MTEYARHVVTFRDNTVCVNLLVPTSYLFFIHTLYFRLLNRFQRDSSLRTLHDGMKKARRSVPSRGKKKLKRIANSDERLQLELKGA